MHSTISLIVIFLAMFGTIYVIVSAWNRREIAMIEAGMNPKRRKERKHAQLRIALLMIFVPIGILVGNLTHGLFNMDAEPAAIIFSFLFGGIALAGTYFIEHSKVISFEEE